MVKLECCSVHEDEKRSQRRVAHMKLGRLHAKALQQALAVLSCNPCVHILVD